MPRRMTPELHRRIEAMLAAGEFHRPIASELGVSLNMITRVSQGRYQALGRTATAEEVLGVRSKGGGYTPTPDEIEEATAKLRQAKREQAEDSGWTPPEVSAALLNAT